MRRFQFSTCLVIGLAVVLTLIPSGQAFAQDEPGERAGVSTKLLGLDAKFSFWPTTAVVGQTVEFFDESKGGPIFWSWDFDDGGTSVQQHPTHTFVQAGNYEVRLTVYNSSEESDEKRNIDVVALQEPNANFTYSPASPEAGQAMNFNRHLNRCPHVLVLGLRRWLGQRTRRIPCTPSPMRASTMSCYKPYLFGFIFVRFYLFYGSYFIFHIYCYLVVFLVCQF